LNVSVLLQPFYIIERIPAIKWTMPSSILAAIRSLGAASVIAVNAVSKMYAALFAVPILIDVVTFFHAGCCHIRQPLCPVSPCWNLRWSEAIPISLRAMIDGFRLRSTHPTGYASPSEL
jgi:hypothetical protein